MPLPSAIWPNFWDPLTIKIFWPYGYEIKKVHNILLYDAGQFYVKSKMAAEYKSVKSFPVKAID